MKKNVVETTNMIGPKMYINHHWINHVGFFFYVDPILKMALKAGLGFQGRTDKHNGKMNTSSFYAIKHYMIYATICYTNDHWKTG